jgi:hypothetical protein
LIGGFVEYEKEKMDKGEHHLSGSITLEGTRKNHFCHFCKKERREKVTKRFKGYQSSKDQLITKLLLKQLIPMKY